MTLPETQPPVQSEATEMPNFISLLYEAFPDSSIVRLLHENENLFFSLFMALSVSLLLVLGARGVARVPTGFQGALEWFVEVARDFVVGLLGERGVKFVPLLCTLFVYIFCINIMGLIPLMKSPPTNVNITVGLAICVFVLVMYLNVHHHGFFGFVYHLLGSPKGVLGWLIVPIIFPVEVINQLTRPLTLSLRLFGNITGEEILIMAFASMGIALVSSLNFPVGLPLQVPFMFLAILTSLMQALVFTLLSAIYILLSMKEEENESPEGGKNEG